MVRRAAAGPGSRAGRFSASVSTISGTPGPAIWWSQSMTSWPTVMAGNVAGSTSWGTRPSISVVSGTTTPRAGVPAATIPSRRRGPRQRRRRHGPHRRTIAGTRACHRREPGREPARRRRPPTAAAGSSRSRTGRAAHTMTQARQQPDLGAEFVGLRRHEERADDRHEEGEHDPSGAAGGHGLRVGDHEEQEDQHLGRGHDHPPEVEPHTGANAQRAVMQCPEAARSPMPTARRDPERRRHAEQVQPAGDQQPHADDHG